MAHSIFITKTETKYPQPSLLPPNPRYDSFSKTRAIKAALFATLGIVGHILPSTIYAASVNLQTMAPTMESHYVLTEDAMLTTSESKDSTFNDYRKNQGRFHLGLTYNVLNDPLVELDESRTQRVSTVVDSLHTADFTLGYSIYSRIAVGINMPVNIIRIPGFSDQFEIGDSRLFVKGRLTPDESPVAFSLMPEVKLPTGNKDLYLSDDSVGFGMIASAESDFKVVRVAAHIGYHRSSGAIYKDVDRRQTVPVGIGTFIHINEEWGANIEANGGIKLPGDSHNNPGELYAGPRWQFTKEGIATAGLSIGSLTETASQDLRFILGLNFSIGPKEESNLPIKAEIKTAAVKVEKIEKKETPRVVFTPKKIEISEEIKFAHASDVLTDSGKSLLDEVAAVMKQNQASFKKIRIEGHTNRLGKYDYNMKLSKARAASVREYLKSRGIPELTLDSEGFGYTRPKVMPGVSDKTKLDANRRVEFMVVK